MRGVGLFAYGTDLYEVGGINGVNLGSAENVFNVEKLEIMNLFNNRPSVYLAALK